VVLAPSDLIFDILPLLPPWYVSMAADSKAKEEKKSPTLPPLSHLPPIGEIKNLARLFGRHLETGDEPVTRLEDTLREARQRAMRERPGEEWLEVTDITGSFKVSETVYRGLGALDEESQLRVLAMVGSAAQIPLRAAGSMHARNPSFFQGLTGRILYGQWLSGTGVTTDQEVTHAGHAVASVMDIMGELLAKITTTTTKAATSTSKSTSTSSAAATMATGSTSTSSRSDPTSTSSRSDPTSTSSRSDPTSISSRSDPPPAPWDEALLADLQRGLSPYLFHNVQSVLDSVRSDAVPGVGLSLDVLSVVPSLSHVGIHVAGMVVSSPEMGEALGVRIPTGGWKLVTPENLRRIVNREVNTHAENYGLCVTLGVDVELEVQAVAHASRESEEALFEAVWQCNHEDRPETTISGTYNGEEDVDEATTASTSSPSTSISSPPPTSTLPGAGPGHDEGEEHGTLLTQKRVKMGLRCLFLKGPINIAREIEEHDGAVKIEEHPWTLAWMGPRHAVLAPGDTAGPPLEMRPEAPTTEG
jgi:hypothetical protein